MNSRFKSGDWIVLGALMGAAPVLAWFLFHVNVKTEPSPAPPASIVPTLPESPKVDRSEEDHAFEQASERKFAAIERCEKQGGTAAIGFGTTVVCVKAMWVEDPKFPPWRSSPPK